MRDLETIEGLGADHRRDGALPCFGTLHTNSAVHLDHQPRHRRLPAAPQQSQASGPSSSCRARKSGPVAVADTPPMASGSGRVAALEIMIPNAAIRNLIREDKLHQIYSSDADRPGAPPGMQTLNQHLAQLYHEGASHHPTPGRGHRRRHRSDPETKLQQIASRGRRGGRRASGAMTAFVWEARGRAGELKTGVMEADAAEAVEARLNDAALLVPVSVHKRPHAAERSLHHRREDHGHRGVHALVRHHDRLGPAHCAVPGDPVQPVRQQAVPGRSSIGRRRPSKGPDPVRRAR